MASLRELPPVRRLLNLPIQTKLYVLVGILVGNLVVVIAIGATGMSILSSLRAYVGGEGLWAKAQKDAVVALRAYARSSDEKDYAAFLAELKVPLGDRKARVELEKEEPDLDAVARGFVEGGNHPDDVEGLLTLFRRYRGLKNISRAIAIWRQGDAMIGELQADAEDLHRAVRAGAPRAEITRRLNEIDALNARFTALEVDFSSSLGEASRWAMRVLFWAMILGSALCGGLGLSVALLISGSIVDGVREIARGAGRAARGDLSVRVRVATDDELGRLADSFNRMVEGLSQIDRMKTEFVSTVSHELRTPLTLALAPVESLLAGQFGALDDEKREMLEVVRGNGLRLLQMVNGLLDFAKLEAGKVEVKREPLDVVAFARSLVDDFRPIASARGLALDFEAEAAAPYARVDRYILERVVFNLLSNAVKFTPSGGRVSARVVLRSNRLSVAVKDTGIGISKEDQARLFQRFRQIESSMTRRYEGTGLGLALVKEFAGLLDGTVSVESAPGRGSEFRVEVAAPRCGKPAAEGAAPRRATALPREAPPALGAPPPEEPSADRARALIVEDNLELSAYLSRVLRDLAATRLARDGVQALELARGWRPDLVISDVMMPGMDGLALCRELKADPALRATPVVLLTALTDRESLLRGWEAGADEYLFKPFHPNEVRTRVRTLLAAVRARREAEEGLARKTRELERSNAELEQFAFVASHDLQDPLRKIVGFARLAEGRAGGGADPQTRDLLRRIAAGAAGMQELIDGLLEYSRVGRASAPLRPVDTGAAFGRAVGNLETAIAESGATVASGALPTLPADPALLVHLFQNLVGNAIKFRAGRPPTVRVAAERRGPEWVFSVADDGIGIEPRDLERVFRLFARARGRGEYPGHGIGLAVCKRIVERHGGRIWAESEPGRGATFFFTLPADGAAARPSAAAG